MAAGTRVLLCADQPLIRDALASLVESASGYSVVAQTTTDLDEVRNALAQSGPDVIVIDFEFTLEPTHDLSAFERVLDVLAPIATLVVSSELDPDACQAAVSRGISGIVLKSSGRDVLLSALDTARRGQVWLDRDLLNEMFDNTLGRRRARGEQEKISQLTRREREIFQVACTGITNKQIAEKLSISEATVRHHLGAIFAKLGVSTRSELVVYGYRNKLAEPVPAV